MLSLDLDLDLDLCLIKKFVGFYNLVLISLSSMAIKYFCAYLLDRLDVSGILVVIFSRMWR